VLSAEHTPAARGTGTARPRASEHAQDHCARCGIREPHVCAFRTVALHTFCTRCGRWVGTDHVCDAAHCVVCDQHGITLASHALPVDLSPPKREWARP